MLAPSGRNYEDFKRQIPDIAMPLLDGIRSTCMSLGDNVIEDVRMHRVVFCKSMTFRWFADIEPQQDGIIVKIQKSRKEPVQTVHISDMKQISELGDAFRDAYEQIH
ncbi:MAG: hypothetical protein EB830_02950 [Nitrosopumilus sp. H13]|nr:MAG: hypothetical protein EB830_02950 [Nitrosopumilus sp. H13]